MERAGFHRGPHCFRHLSSGGRRCLRQQQDEFLATEAGDEVTAPQALAQLVGDNLQHLVPGQMPITVVDALEMIQVEDRHGQMATILLPFDYFALDPLAPGRAVGQTGQGVEQGFLALLFQVLAVTERFVLHVRHPFRQPLQAPRQLLLAAVPLVLVLVHGDQQAFQAVFQDVLEAIDVGSALHTALQPIDMLAQLGVQLASGGAVVSMAGAGLVQVALEAFKALIELLQVGFELVLAAVGDRQHEHGEVIQHRNQLVPVQAPGNALAHLQRLGLVPLGQAQVIEQADQGLLDVRSNLAVGRLYGVGQGIGAVFAKGFFKRLCRLYFCQGFADGRFRLGRFFLWQWLGGRGVNCFDQRRAGYLKLRFGRYGRFGARG